MQIENSIDIEKCLAHGTRHRRFCRNVLENSIDIEKCLAPNFLWIHLSKIR